MAFKRELRNEKPQDVISVCSLLHPNHSLRLDVSSAIAGVGKYLGLAKCSNMSDLFY